MNHIYSVVFNAALGQYQVASEKARRYRSTSQKTASAVIAGALLLSSSAMAADVIITDKAVNVSDHPSTTFSEYKFETSSSDTDWGWDVLKKSTNEYIKLTTDEAVGYAELSKVTENFEKNISYYINDNKGALVIDKNKVFETQSVTTLEAGKSLVIATTAGQKLSFKNSAGDKDLSQLLKIKGNSISQTTFALLGKEDARIDISSYKSLNLGSDNKAKISTGGEDGAIYLNFTNATLNYVTFKDNYAEVEDNRAGSGWTRASVMHLKGSFVTVDNTIFENNEAKAGDGTVLEGGLIFLESGKILEGYPGTLVIRNSNFKNNIGTAEYRAEGGLYML